MEIEGTVFDGMNVAEEYLSLKPYQEKIEDLTGFKPFPGTLNVKTKQGEADILHKKDFERIDGFEFEGESYSGLNLYPITVEDTEAYYIEIDVSDYDDSVIEIIAPKKLREELDVEEGDKVTIRDHR